MTNTSPDQDVTRSEAPAPASPAQGSTTAWPRRALERLRAQRRLGRAVLLAAPIFVVWLLLVITGLRGVDFGFHWDEEPWHIAPVRAAIANGVLLPRSYIYPGFDKWLVMAPAAVEALRVGLETAFDPAPMQAAMVAAANKPDYLLSARRVFIVVSSFGVLWTYGAALAFGLRWWAALAAACAFGLSWELAYHSRFVATDALLTQFSALVLMTLGLYFRTRRAHWLYAAAVAAGFATGTKYTGVFLLLPILLASLLTRLSKQTPWELDLLAEVRRGIALCAVAFAAYVVTTPSTLLDPFLFIREVRWISALYEGAHGGYTAKSGWDHARIAFEFLSIGYFSRFKLLAVTLFATALVGLGLWLRRDRLVVAVLLVFPIAFLTVFCYKFRIVSVRNYLFLTPILSLFIGRAFTELAARISRPAARGLLAVPLLAAFGLQAGWLVWAGESIRKVDPAKYVRDALDYAARRPETTFRLSSKVRSIAVSKKMPIPPNVTGARDAETVVFFARADGPDGRIWKSNDPFQAKAVFGPGDVNFDWYSSWWGNDRVVVMTLEKARATKVPLAL